MRLLLDTHIALWWMGQDRRLSAFHSDAIRDGNNQVHVSAITIAEISIKTSLGKLRTPGGLEEAALSGGLAMLPLMPSHAKRLEHLPLLHRDPFDRMLVAQAQTDGLTLLTADVQVKQYDVATL